MKYLIIVSIMIFNLQLLLAQFGRNTNNTRKTYTVETEVRTTAPHIQMADQHRRFDFEASLESLDNAVAQNLNSVAALVTRAKYRQISGMEAEAKEDLRMAEQINPQIYKLYTALYNQDGLIHLMSFEPQQAVQELSDFKKLNYYYQTLDRRMLAEHSKINKLANVESIITEIEDDNLDVSLSRLDLMLIDYPNSAILYDLKGLIYIEQGKLLEARTAFNSAIALDPNFAIAWYNLGQLEREQNNLNQAKLYLDKAIDLQSNLTKAYFERALTFKELGQEKDAVDDYNAIINKEGSSYENVLLNRGLTKIMSGDFNGAMNDLNKVIEDQPNNAELRKNRGNLYTLFGLYDLAIEDFSLALDLDGDYAEAYYNRGLCFMLTNDNFSACSDFTKSVQLGYEKAIENTSYFCNQ